MDPAFYALSLLRRRKFDKAIETSTTLLDRNPYDQQVWWIKARALTNKNWIDDTEMEEEGVAEVLLDENAVAAVPRPGTSLRRPASTAGRTGNRPISNAGGRPVSGFVRPGSQSQRTTSRAGVDAAFQGSRPGTSRPVTSSGRFVRLGTASLKSEPGGPFINAERLDLKKYAQRQPLAKVLCDYILYHDHNPRRALELCAEATEVSKYGDWWWKARLAKCYYQLGLYRDAEKQFKSALKHGDHVVVLLELAKVYYKLDQPLTAKDIFEKHAEKNTVDMHLTLGIARTYEQLNEPEKAAVYFKRVLEKDATSAEAIACLASNAFYEDQPEVALRLYRRLLHMGVNNSELWNNLGLCCFYASQYDTALSCFERSLTLASDDTMGDIWYNIGQVAIGIGDLGLAYQAFKVSISIDPNHAESFNNLAILELRKGNIDVARNNFATAATAAPYMHEAHYNGALLAYKLGEFQDSFNLCNKALEAFPDHAESLELRKQLKLHFNVF
jgi:tetratricopeptide repeat protein 8